MSQAQHLSLSREHVEQTLQELVRAGLLEVVTPGVFRLPFADGGGGATKDAGGEAE